MKVLLAVDGSRFSDAAIDEVAKRAWPANSEIKLISVIDPPYQPAAEPWAIPPSYFGELEMEVRGRTQKIIESSLERLRQHLDPTVEISADTPMGRAKHEIVQAAEDWGADLIVLGSHGYGAWERFLLGSVSNSVAIHAPCSVEIVRHRPQADRKVA